MSKAERSLHRTVGTSQYFTLGFGGIVGVGWILVLGDLLDQAGPMGAIVAFLAGGVVMILVGLCYAELAARFPVSGGELAYAYEIFGLRTAFVVGWALALNNIAAVGYVSLGMAWILDVIVPGIQGPALYDFRGVPVHLGSLLVALGGVAGLTYINYRGIDWATRLQDALTYTKLGLALAFIATGILRGHFDNAIPLFRSSPSGSPWPGILAVVATTPFFYGGFNTIPQAVEERKPGTSLLGIGRMIVLSIVVSAAFYCLVILSASMAIPWEQLVTMDLPTATAFEVAFGSKLLAKTVLVAGLLGVVTVGNASVLAGSRILFALGRGRIITPRLANIHPVYGTPDRAVIVVGVFAAGAVFFGRQGILPIVAIGSTYIALSYAVTCLGVIRLRADSSRAEPLQARKPGSTTGAVVAFLAAVFLLLTAIYQPLVHARGSFPVEWIALVGGATLGKVLWIAARDVRHGTSPRDRQALIGAREEGRSLGVP